ncbi:family 1 glycosylhydrolase [Nocardia transvalensis]|uniref:family 1 glycosylhydrolase n=1 Tax=Nocardia transvalensis TaxID=37333 RepID=UPI00189623A5|nr:family 1 glycosylhydrolase [Nocardia transvalensis]MBF6330763.1 family 1 glycosylhydrolase [Nocardia transvalensis]
MRSSGYQQQPVPPTRVDPLGPDFLWGVASSGFQSEGYAPDNNWMRYIADPRWNHEPYGNSVDFYHRFAEDIDRAAALGVEVFRIGVEWARVQPRPDGPDGGWDEAGFQFYDRVVDTIIAKGMRPMITLDHWVYPGWAYDRGGWQNPEMVSWWGANMRKVVDRYHNRNPLWVTINEPIAYIVHELVHADVHGPEFDRRFHEMEDRFAQVHNAIYDYIHQIHHNAMVTSNVGFVAKDDAAVNDRIFGLMADKLDYIGVDYYYGVATSAAMQLWNMPLQAEGIYYALRRYARKFPGKQLFVVENGMATENGRPGDYRREDYLRDVVYWLQRARMDGIDVVGYNYWSITDNYEWGSYAPRFGLYTVDVTTDPALQRIPTAAVEAYRNITRNGGVAPDYRPTRDPVICSQVDPPSSCDEPVTLPDVS